MTETINAHHPEYESNLLETYILQRLHDFEEMYDWEVPTEEYNLSLFNEMVGRGVNQFPSSPFFLAMCAYPHILNNDWNEAERWIDKASKQGEHFVHYYLRGIIRERLQLTSQAENQFLYAVKRYPDLPRTRYALANHYSNRKRYEEAFIQAMHYARLSTFSPDSVGMMLRLYPLLDEIPQNMYAYMYQTSVILLRHESKESYAHTLYSLICEIRFFEILDAFEKDEPFDKKELKFLYKQMVKHMTLSAIYDHDNRHGNKDLFHVFLRDTLAPLSFSWEIGLLKIRYHFLNAIHKIKFRFN